MVPSDRSPTLWGLATDQLKLLFELVGDRSVTVLKPISNLWNAKLTETQIFRELSIEIESSLSNWITELSNSIRELFNLIRAL